MREIKRLWKGDHPTPRDLLKEMEHPSQVTMERDKYYIARKLLPLSAHPLSGVKHSFRSTTIRIPDFV